MLLTSARQTRSHRSPARATVLKSISSRAPFALTAVDSTGNVGVYTSVTVGRDGLGLISYYDDINGDLKVAHCTDTACSAATKTTLDASGRTVGVYTSVAVGTDRLGLISYYDATNLALRVAHCTDTACSAATETTLDATGNVGRYTSVTVGTDGFGLISYYDLTNGDLKVVHCALTGCRGTPTTASARLGDLADRRVWSEIIVGQPTMRLWLV